MSIPNYRVVLSFDAERKLFVARAPELEHCFAEGASRAEAIDKLEQEIEALLKNMQERGGRPPPAVDEAQWSGEITAKVSRALHRDLAWQARSDGIELSQLVSELLAGALEARRPQRQHGRPQRQGEPHDNVGNQREPHDRDRRGGGYAQRFHMMEDRANFIEYVRGLESDSRDLRGSGRPRPSGSPSADRGGDRQGRRRRGRGPFRGDRPREGGGSNGNGGGGGSPEQEG